MQLVNPAKCLPPAPPTATLTLTKTVINDNGGTATAASFQAKIDGGNVSWGVAQTLAVGSHAVSESALAGYGASSWGGDCAANGTIVLSAGENKTCTITNNDQSGHLIVDKVTQPAGFSTIFSVTASGTGAIMGSASGTTTDAFLLPNDLLPNRPGRVLGSAYPSHLMAPGRLAGTLFFEPVGQLTP